LLHSSRLELMSKNRAIDDGVGQMASSHTEAATATGPGRPAIVRGCGCGARDGQLRKHPRRSTRGQDSHKGNREVSVSGDQADTPPRIARNPSRFGEIMQYPRE
jgi:hypothetical protein